MSEDLRDLLIDGALRLGLDLSDAKVGRFAIYLEELLKWNEKINLTSIVDEREIIIRHFLDSLVLCSFLKDGERVLDMGSGAGFPGLALKIANPALDIVCMDKVEKKVKFMRHIIRTLCLDGVSAVSARAEDEGALGDLSGSFDVAVSRAFAGISDFLTLALPYLKTGGRIIAVKGPKSAKLRKEADEAILREALEGLILVGYKEIDIPLSDRASTVITFQN